MGWGGTAAPICKGVAPSGHQSNEPPLHVRIQAKQLGQVHSTRAHHHSATSSELLSQGREGGYSGGTSEEYPIYNTYKGSPTALSFLFQCAIIKLD